MSSDLKGKKTNILVVDDRAENILAIKNAIDHLGIEVLVFAATSGNEALNLILDHEFGLIMLDVQMPDMDGFELAELIRGRQSLRHIPLIFVTAGAVDSGLMFKGYEAGAVDFLHKPFDPQILCGKVRVFVELDQNRRLLKGQLEQIKLKNAEIERSEANFRGLTEAIPQMVWTSGPDGLVDYVNQRWADYAGVNTESLLGKALLALTHHEDIDHSTSTRELAFAESRGFGVESRLRGGDGVFRWHLCRAVPLKDNEGRVIRWFGTDTDIDDQKKWQEDLSEAKAQAVDASQSKSIFLANMSHEIRTPLGAILGFAELLQDPEITASESSSNIEIIIRNSRDLQRLIDEILDLSKVESGKLEIEILEVSPLSLLKEVVTLLEPSASAKGIELKIESLEGVPKRALTDPTRLRQILINMIGNAIKYTSVGGVLVSISKGVTESEQHQQILFKIKDTGIGIDSASVERIFQPFIQADSSTTRKFGGTGLGLALSRRLARALGGDVTFSEAERGTGSVFVVSVAMEELDWNEVEPSMIPSISTFEEPHLSGIRVLIVDDTPDNRMLIRRILVKQGALVQVACNGFEGVEKAKFEDFDMIIMDIQMPQMDGFEAVSHLREGGYVKPIIALSAHAMKEDRDRCLASGFDAHLSKPLDIKHLIATISKLIRSSSGAWNQGGKGSEE